MSAIPPKGDMWRVFAGIGILPMSGTDKAVLEASLIRPRPEPEVAHAIRRKREPSTQLSLPFPRRRRKRERAQ